MNGSDWYEVRFLESTENLKGLIKKSFGRTPSTKIANQIGVCIQQGRLFFEAASSAPLQIKPLQIYYGILAFGKAIVLSRKLVSIDTLAQSHGLSDISSHSDGIEKLCLRINNRGDFQEFNDTIAPLGRIWYFDQWMPKWASMPFSEADGLSGQKVNLTEIMSRIPALSRLFQRTFGSSPNSLPVQLNFDPTLTSQCQLRIDDSELFSDAKSLATLIRRRRRDYPFLTKWCFSEAALAWGSSILTFRNVDRGSIDDIAPESLIFSKGGFSSAHELAGTRFKEVYAFDILPPLSGGFTHELTYAIRPIENTYLSEFSLQFLASYLLSSLVRYRPQAWQHAISRTSSPDSPSDDRSLALVEQFLALVLEAFPKLVVRTIDYSRDN